MTIDIQSADHNSMKQSLDIAHSLKDWFSDQGLKNMAVDFKLNNLVVAKTGNQVVGFICYTTYSGKMIIIWMGIARQHQRQGIGGKLLKWLENQAKEFGCYALEVETLPDKYDYSPYKQTRSFYYKNGFKKVGYKKAKLPDWDDQIILEKEV